MILKKTYVEYLLNTPINYTCSNLSAHLDSVSHDAVTDFLANSDFEPSALWRLVRDEIDYSKEGFLIVDDSVQDKRYSRFIALVKRQYSGNEKGLLRGINLVNMVYSEGTADDFYPVDYRVYAPSEDEKTKNDHFREMFLEASANKMLPTNTILFDSWYASVANLRLIHFEGWTFFTTLKSNRKVSLSKETGYVNLQDLVWSTEAMRDGMVIKLKNVPFLVKLFLIAHKDGSREYVITNYLGEDLLVEHVENTKAIGLQIGEFHRSFKQLTGSEKCQCRKAKSQRNHFACCYHAWVSLKKQAKLLQLTIYQVRNNIFENFLKEQLINPTVKAL
jgi:DDE superfamily endonuclease